MFWRSYLLDLAKVLCSAFSERKGKDNCGMCSALVITSLRSIVDDQIEEAEGLGLTAASVADANLGDISSGKYQLVFASAEDTLDKSFLKMLKGPSEFHKRVSAIIINESHTVET